MSELIVPMDVRALCASRFDSEKTATNFAGTTLDFSQLPHSGGKRGPCISSRDTILRTLDEAPLHQLKAGVHLHWSLPRVLTHGSLRETDSEIEFPTVPNRWLIIRIVTDTLQYKSWVIESDHLHQEVPPDATITLAVNHDVPFRYMGRAVEASSWQESQPTENLRNLTGKNLMAVHTGEPIFTAYYPNCLSVFGFYDDLADISSDVSLMYAIAGWYSDTSHDPLYGGLSPEQIEAKYHWQFSGTAPTVSLYSGTVQGITWHPNSPYFPPDDDVNTDVAIGNNVAEALATWISGDASESSERDTLENLIAAFQLGLFNEFVNSDVDQLPSLLDKLHQAGFGAANGGTLWTIVKEGNLDTEVVELPEALAEALNDLNNAQQSYDAAEQRMVSLRWQLYSDWYRYCLAEMDHSRSSGPSDNDIRTYLNAELEQLFNSNYLTNQLTNLSSTLTSKKSTVEAKLMGTVLQLKALAAPRYFQAHDPVVLLTGVDLTHRFAGLGPRDPIRCRTSDRILSEIVISGTPIRASEYSLSLPGQLPYQMTCERLLAEACLLNLQLLQGRGLTVSQEALGNFLSANQTNNVITGFTGTPPLSLSVQCWNGNPWLPVLMQWGSDYFPLENIYGSDTYDTNLVTGNFAIDNALVELIPQNGLPKTEIQTYGGSGVLSPLATKRLATAIAKLQSGNLPQELYGDLEMVLSDLQNTPIVFQALSGFNDALLMRSQTPQLPVTAPNPPNHFDRRLTPQVADGVGNENTHASFPNGYFNPIRGGILENLTLSLIDVFGRKRTVKPQKFRCSPSLRLGNSEDNKQVYLAPRITQPARLLFRYLAEEGDRFEMSPILSPVCGWVLPNHLENSLMFYDQDHQPRGSLYISGDRVIWRTAPGTGLGDAIADALSGANLHLQNLATAIQNNGAGFMRAFLNNINTVSATVFGNYKNPALSVLMGQPLALVQASLKLEILGQPGVNQSWTAFENEIANATATPATFLDRRQTNGFTQMKFPVQLGDLHRTQDGLVGYFAANGSSYNFSMFYGIAATNENKVELPAPITIAPDDPVRKFLMLVDPRAKIHATMGFLPTKAIEIPSNQYAQMLSAMELNFPVSAVLGPADRFVLPLPKEVGFDWLWVEHQGTEWPPATPVGTPSTQGLFDYTPQQINSGWLQLKRQPSESQ